MKKSLTALAFGTLALGMAEFVMMGILPDVARDLGVSIPRAGDLISAYAIGVCVGAPATVLIARKRALKGILLALAALIVLGNVCIHFVNSLDHFRRKHFLRRTAGGYFSLMDHIQAVTIHCRNVQVVNCGNYR